MEVIKYCKLQIGILLILLFISYLFIKDGNRLNRKLKEKKCNKIFDILFVLAELAVIFDGITAYTVNHLDSVSSIINMICHLIYLLTYQSFIFFHFIYWLSATDNLPQNRIKKILCYAPYIISIIVTIVFIPKIYYFEGIYTNYSKGISATSCFLTIFIYSMLTMIKLISRSSYIQKNKRVAFIMSHGAVLIITITQLIFNETLVASIAVILVVLSIYLCMENPTIKYLELYHNEMVMGFATLVESKDGSTGGHIKRSSAYALLIANQLRKKKDYKNIITKDFLDDLGKAAPMHDIGKIAVPDNILQKPGKLTNEEYAIMKTHAEIGGKIVLETFGHLDDDEYENMAYDVAMYHHEKWNGKGYPKGLKGDLIPLAARIMAVADVFDAVSAKRCYRDALPLDVCYKIILDGKGQDFDPDVVDAFFNQIKEVKNVYYNIKE